MKSIIITNNKWDLLVDLTEVLLIFADVTTELEESNYVISSLYVKILIEIIKILIMKLSNQQTYINK